MGKRHVQAFQREKNMNRPGKKHIHIANQRKLQQFGNNSTVGKDVDK